MARQIDLHFPSGVSRRPGNRAGAMGRREYSAPWGLNCRLEDTLTKRLRGGSFNGEVSLVLENILLEDGGALLFEDGSSLLTEYARTLVTMDKTYRHRTIELSANAIRFSRRGVATDYTFSADVSDTARPTILQLSEAGETGSTVVSIAPFEDAHMLCWTADETWVLHGEPTNGTLRSVSDEVGLIAEAAWCFANDACYFLSSRGLYSVGADGSNLRAVSEDSIPDELIDISDDDCVLSYRHADRGVYIHLSSSPSWFYDTARDQFWPFDTNETDSHILIGPIKLGSTDTLGLIQTLHGIIAQSSATVNWRIVPGTTAEEAAVNGKLAITAAVAGTDYSSYVRGSGSFAAGRSQTFRPRVEAMWAVIWLSSEGTWAYEGMTLGLEPGGSWRK